MKDKIVLVTGGVRGIGDAISKKFLEAGDSVIAAATNEDRNKKWYEACKKAGFDKAETKVVNVADFDDCQKMIEEIKNKHGKIDILVNNAGITRDVTFKKMTKEEWDQVLRTDLDSIFNVTRPVLDVMLENNFGRIINVSSVNGLRGSFGQTNYAAAKAGMHGFTMSLALETAKKNITVNTVSPGFIETDMLKNIPEEVMAQIVAQIPVGRLGKAEEIAAMVAFLASEVAAYITGANFSVNGGLYMH